ncbi:MAG TPA: hypothetical protein P5079_03630, partial [Elusimicrobiota bacterium]|nr:hypothetical protein [Elusimicrobiota bacterium]
MAAVFLATTVLSPFAQAQSIPSSLSSSLVTSAAQETNLGVDIPADAGALVEFQWFGKESPLTLFHIQDAHGLVPAQFNAARILKAFLAAWRAEKNAKEPEPLLVCVEGAVDRVETDWISAYPSEPVRRRVAQSLLSNGEITGEEYAAILENPRLFEIRGVEDPALYAQHTASKRDTDSLRTALAGPFNELETWLESLKRSFYSAALWKVDHLRRDYLNEKISFHDFLNSLRPLSPAGFSWAAYPQMRASFELAAMESRLNRAELAAEREVLLGR